MQYSSFSRLSDPIPETNLTHCSTGVVASPNYNGSYYPDLLDKTERIEVESGKVVRLEFTFFQVQHQSTCSRDYVEIKDGNGKTLMGRTCGWSEGVSPTHSWFIKPEVLTSETNSVEISFHTDSNTHHKGWSLNWTAVTPGRHCVMMKLKLQQSLLIESKHSTWIKHSGTLCLWQCFKTQMTTRNILSLPDHPLCWRALQSPWSPGVSLWEPDGQTRQWTQGQVLLRQVRHRPDLRT